MRHVWRLLGGIGSRGGDDIVGFKMMKAGLWDSDGGSCSQQQQGREIEIEAVAKKALRSHAML